MRSHTGLQNKSGGPRVTCRSNTVDSLWIQKTLKNSSIVVGGIFSKDFINLIPGSSSALPLCVCVCGICTCVHVFQDVCSTAHLCILLSILSVLLTILCLIIWDGFLADPGALVFWFFFFFGQAGGPQVVRSCLCHHLPLLCWGYKPLQTQLNFCPGCSDPNPDISPALRAMAVGVHNRRFRETETQTGCVHGEQLLQLTQ